MGCLNGCKTYNEYAELRDTKKTLPSNEIVSRRKWKASERENRRKILWEEAKITGLLYGRPLKEYIFNRYKCGAEKRNIEFLITQDEFNGFWKSPCYYCGDGIETIGLDRMDSNRGYILQNIVPCCTNCNLSKRKMSDIKFIEMCKKVSAKH